MIIFCSLFDSLVDLHLVASTHQTRARLDCACPLTGRSEIVDERLLLLTHFSLYGLKLLTLFSELVFQAIVIVVFLTSVHFVSVYVAYACDSVLSGVHVTFRKILIR